jgi:phasin
MTVATMKPKPAKAATATVLPFEMPKFEIPNFDLPKMEVPAVFREFAEKGVAQTKLNYEKFKAVAEENTEMLETVYSTASKGGTDYGLKMIEIARTNTDAMFNYVEAMFGVKSPSEFAELSTKYAREQFETLAGQSKALAGLAQKVATETAEPIKSGVTKAMKKVA